jgi:hypothetical protein
MEPPKSYACSQNSVGIGQAFRWTIAVGYDLVDICSAYRRKDVASPERRNNLRRVSVASGNGAGDRLAFALFGIVSGYLLFTRAEKSAELMFTADRSKLRTNLRFGFGRSKSKRSRSRSYSSPCSRWLISSETFTIDVAPARRQSRGVAESAHCTANCLTTKKPRGDFASRFDLIAPSSEIR